MVDHGLVQRCRAFRPPQRENQILTALLIQRMKDSNRETIQLVLQRYRNAISLYNQGYEGPWFNQIQAMEYKMSKFVHYRQEIVL